jgi:hypothetical protein
MSSAAAKPLLAFLMLLAGGSLALGQAGSTGGTIGKTDKSVSGGEAAPANQTQTKSRSKDQGPIDKGDQPSSKQNLVTAVIGSWDWEGSCASGGSWQGGIILESASGNNFTGKFEKGHVGSLVGTVNGNSISFDRSVYCVKQHWAALISGSGRTKLRMSGTFSDPSHTGCRFSARKS